jgi:hypothetical protein
MVVADDVPFAPSKSKPLRQDCDRVTISDTILR